LQAGGQYSIVRPTPQSQAADPDDPVVLNDAMGIVRDFTVRRLTHDYPVTTNDGPYKALSRVAVGDDNYAPFAAALGFSSLLQAVASPDQAIKALEDRCDRATANRHKKDAMVADGNGDPSNMLKELKKAEGTETRLHGHLETLKTLLEQFGSLSETKHHV